LLELFFFDAGGGHRSAATALKAIIASRFPHWCVDLVNLQEVLQPFDPIHKLTGLQFQDVYNAALKRGWTFGPFWLRGLQQAIRLCTSPMENLLQEHWQDSRPDLVVSLIPNFNGVMFRALRRVHPQVPYVTVMTDLADYPPHFWQEKQDQFIICGSEMAVRQAQATRYRPERIFQASGMILKPQFYQDGQGGDERAYRSAREDLGLDPSLPTALIMFGGFGAKTAVEIIDRLDHSGLKVQSIVMCGHNEKLRQELQGRESCHAVGFTEKVPHYMRLADFFIGKPGPGSLSEAVHMGLPVIIENNARTLPQERYNTVWVEEQELGVVLSSFRHIAEAVRFLLEDNRLEQFHCNARHITNRAVYEIPVILEQIV
jgi:1,2-diacylglycerol 3-beta-galactosyltransferase